MEQPPSSPIVLERFEALASRGRVLVSVQVLTFAPHKLTIVVGPNGAGKTSLLRGMAGVLTVRGEARVGAMPLSLLAARQRSFNIAYQPQGTPRADGLTVAEFVASARGGRSGWLSGYGAEDEAQVRRGLELAGAAPFAGRRLSTLSGGEAARASLASTLALGAGWLLLDEPAAAADAAAARTLYVLLRRLIAAEDVSIVAVEHDLGLARSFADDVVLISNGRVVIHGAAQDVFESAELGHAYSARFLQHEAEPGLWAVVAAEQVAGATKEDAR